MQGAKKSLVQRPRKGAFASWGSARPFSRWLLHAAVAGRLKGGSLNDPFYARLQQLEPVVHPALPSLLMQVASAYVPDQTLGGKFWAKGC